MDRSKQYTIEDMLRFQLCDEDGVFIVHADTNKPYYVYELAEIYYQKRKNILKNTDFVDNKIKSAFFKRGTRKKLFNSIDVDNMVKMSKEGISKRQIAKIYHCDEKTIRNYLKNRSQ